MSTDKEPDLHPALSGDEVYTPSPRRSEGWCGQLFARCSNRTTSKTSILTLNEQRNLHRALHIHRCVRSSFCSKYFFFFKKLFPPVLGNSPRGLPSSSRTPSSHDETLHRFREASR